MGALMSAGSRPVCLLKGTSHYDISRATAHPGGCRALPPPWALAGPLRQRPCIIAAVQGPARPGVADRHRLLSTSVATEKELSEFLRSVEKRAYKRSLYHVRDPEAALDIVQDSMLKLAQHYGDKPLSELPMLFQRILSNTTLDWFRRQKTRKALFSNLSELSGPADEDDFDLLESLEDADSAQTESAQDALERAQILRELESHIMELPGRQREAFLLRYWEEMDVAETAALMGCSEGSVKTHCSRAVQALSKALGAKGLQR